jgi:hypothetical protein
MAAYPIKRVLCRAETDAALRDLAVTVNQIVSVCKNRIRRTVNHAADSVVRLSLLTENIDAWDRYLIELSQKDDLRLKMKGQ